MTLLSRLQRLEPRETDSLQHLSMRDLCEKALELDRVLLREPNLPPEVRADLLAEIADAERCCAGYDSDRLARTQRMISFLTNARAAGFG